MDIPWKTLIKTVLKSLVIILPINLIIIWLAVQGFFGPGSTDGGPKALPNGDPTVLPLFAISYFIPYFAVGYFGFIKERRESIFCIITSVMCYLITAGVTYVISQYLFVNNIFAYIPFPGFWHVDPGGSELKTTLYYGHIFLKTIIGLILAILASLVVPAFFYLKILKLPEEKL